MVIVFNLPSRAGNRYDTDFYIMKARKYHLRCHTGVDPGMSTMGDVVTPRPGEVDKWQPPRALEWVPVFQAPFKDSQGIVISTHYELKIS